MWWICCIARMGLAQPGPDDPLAEPVAFAGQPANAIVARVDDTSWLGHPAWVRHWVPRLGDRRVVSVVPAAGVTPEGLAQWMRAQPGVAWAHPDPWVVLVPDRGPELPNDPYFPAQWSMWNQGQHDYVPGVDVNPFEAWAWSRGSGTRIAILDSGIDVDHPDLDVVDGPDFVDEDGSSDPTDGNGHGTAVAGIAAAMADNSLGVAGVAPDAALLGVRVVGGDISLARIRGRADERNRHTTTSDRSGSRDR